MHCKENWYLVSVSCNLRGWTCFPEQQTATIFVALLDNLASNAHNIWYERQSFWKDPTLKIKNKKENVLLEKFNRGAAPFSSTPPADPIQEYSCSYFGESFSLPADE